MLTGRIKHVRIPDSRFCIVMVRGGVNPKLIQIPVYTTLCSVNTCGKTHSAPRLPLQTFIRLHRAVSPRGDIIFLSQLINLHI